MLCTYAHTMSIINKTSNHCNVVQIAPLTPRLAGATRDMRAIWDLSRPSGFTAGFRCTPHGHRWSLSPPQRRAEVVGLFSPTAGLLKDTLRIAGHSMSFGYVEDPSSRFGVGLFLCVFAFQYGIPGNAIGRGFELKVVGRGRNHLNDQSSFHSL
jgi:hypothetical protein